MLVDAFELLKLVLSRALFFAFGFGCGFFTAVFIWVVYKVLPKLDTYISLIGSYHNFRVSEKRRLTMVLMFIVLGITLLVLLFLLAVWWVAHFV